MTDPHSAALPPGLGHVLRLTDLPQRRASAFDLAPDAAICTALAQTLGLSGLKKLRFAGKLIPTTGKDWRLEARLGATVVQPCGITLEPVTTRIDEDVTRHYLADGLPEIDTPGAETEMPDDDTVEPLPSHLDLGAVLVEALVLAIPPFPRAEGADLGQIAAAPAGVAPLQDEDTKPFAGLAALRDKLDDTPKDED